MTKNSINIVPSNLRSKFAPIVDQEIVLSLDQKQQEFVETDKSSSVNLLQVYDDERQRSTIFRPTFKIRVVMDNAYPGTTTYQPFENQLYYIDEDNTIANCVPNWKGFPQYKEFDLIREDVNLSGYTTGPNAHVNFVTQSATTYNWSIYLTYPHKNLDNIGLECYRVQGNQTPLIRSWIAKDGIPFTIRNRNFNGRNVISFICPMNHGLSVGESFKLNFKYRGNDVFTVDSLGDESVGSELFIFNIDDIGYINGVFSNGITGTFQRIVDAANSAETISKYYVREHKILTTDDETILNKSGFELNGFNSDKKFQFSALTPNKVQRIAEKEGNQSYTVTFKKDLNLNGILDNQKRPLTEIYLTFVNKGYFGWFNNPLTKLSALQYGFDFNITERTNPWWANTNSGSFENNIKVDSYNKSVRNFYFNRSLSKDDVLLGDFCEWNDYLQTERIISPINHKIKFNPDLFQIQLPLTSNLPGYYYRVHYPMRLREFSTYIETATQEEIDAAPNYSFFCQSEQTFRWRDIYTYGFVDEQLVGVDYPFLNGSHYPFTDLTFRIRDEGSFDYAQRLKLIVQPNTDGCTTI
jgi:hypothetical protein